jgi:phosphatidylinositol alpha-mannosyltransferase
MPTLCLAAVAEARVPTVGTFHANHENPRVYGLFRRVLEGYFSRLSERIAVSPAARETVSRHFGGSYTIIPNGVDIERFADAERFPGTDGTFRILFVGRLEPRKGAKFLFRAMPAILEQVPDARLVVVGGGPMSDYYKSHLPEIVAEHVEFAGRVSGDDLARHYASADVFCSPAMGGESFGIVLIEAMAAGAAVVASDIGGYRDVVRDGETGLLVRRGDPDHIAEAILALARDGGLKRRLVEAAREDVEQYSWRRVTRRILDVYESAVNGGVPREDGHVRPAVTTEKSEEGAEITIG